jgi:sulfate transport system permease protein
MIWFSFLVLIPLIAILVETTGNGWTAFFNAITNRQTAAALTLTVGTALLVTVVNVVAGTAIAWVLVRDRFWGKRLLEIVIDIPFALPTIVAGLVLFSLYGINSPIGINVANTQAAVFLAFLFVTLRFELFSRFWRSWIGTSRRPPPRSVPPGSQHCERSCYQRSCPRSPQVLRSRSHGV